MVDHREKFLHILGLHSPGECVGEFQPDSFLEDSGGDEILFKEEVEKGNDGRHPRPHRRDVHAPVLLMLNEGFEVASLYLSQFCLARLSIKVEEEHDGGEGTIDCPRLVVQTPLIPQVALEVFLCGEFKWGEPLKDVVDGVWCTMVVTCCS